MFIDYSEIYKLGIESIDNQHEKWIDLYNEFNDAFFNENSPIKSDKVKETIKGMYDYATYHFKYEEDFMYRIGYKKLADHRRLHRDMDTMIYDCLRKITDGVDITEERILYILRQWIINHILKEDREIKEYMLSNNIQEN